MKMTEQQRNDFINANSGIIGDIAKPYVELAKKCGYTYKDLYNTGVIGMCEGLDRYELEKATTENGVVPLEAFVRIDIRKHISNFIAKPRKHDRFENRVSMDKKIFNDDGSQTTVGDMMKSEEHHENWGAGIDHGRVMELLNSDILREVERIAIRGRFINGLQFDELDVLVQEHLNNPKAKAFHYINMGLRKLQEALGVSAR